MNRIMLILIVGFAVAFAAGGSVGMLVAPAAPSPPAHGGPGPGFGLRHELGLTDQQRDQMRRIWSEVMEGQDRSSHERKRALWEQRNERVRALLTDEQRPQYDEILTEHDQAMQQIDRERFERIKQAVERTRKLLTEEQARKYEEIRRKRRPRGHKGGRGPGPPFGSPRRGGPPSRRGYRGPFPRGERPFGPKPGGPGWFERGHAASRKHPIPSTQPDHGPSTRPT